MNAPSLQQAALATPPPLPSSRPSADRLAAALSASVWRASELGTAPAPVRASGWAELDAELPGGGWPCQALTEILLPCTASCEWRLTGPALRTVAANHGPIVLIGPPVPPHVPGLMHAGVGARDLVWIQAEKVAERLWAAEQLIRANAAAAVLAWVPQARPEQIRRLQISALRCEGLVFVFRPDSACQQASAAPLRLRVAPRAGWALEVQILKRRGALHEDAILLPSVPGGLAEVLPPRLLQPGLPLPVPAVEVSHVVGRAAVRSVSVVH